MDFVMMKDIFTHMKGILLEYIKYKIIRAVYNVKERKNG